MSGRPGRSCERSGYPPAVERGNLPAPASNISPASLTPGTSATVIAAIPLLGTSVGKPRPSTTVSARLTPIGPLDLVDAGSEDQVLTPGERRVDRTEGVRWLGDEELLDRDGRTGRCTAGPGRTR